MYDSVRNFKDHFYIYVNITEGLIFTDIGIVAQNFVGRPPSAVRVYVRTRGIGLLFSTFFFQTGVTEYVSPPID